ncbi:class I SAM-dependent methyltransferase [Frankia nepalensis]|uniref:putative protein N(5)-glutamine methyltransferase n=2 Tax=Frankia nepalensis TaxID=1836974 RepID=UPI001EE441F4|nr:putative protein N(5)-glutamine methyltransferase [Frankia nepalensis]
MSHHLEPSSRLSDFRSLSPVWAARSAATLTETLRAAGCVFAENEAALLIAAAEGPAALAEMVTRRAAGVPIEHILGWAEFTGQRIAVDDGVFVPRHRTEFLVDLATGLALRAAARRPARLVVVDLCCGSGALGAVLATRLAEPAGMRAPGLPARLPGDLDSGSSGGDAAYPPRQRAIPAEERTIPAEKTAEKTAAVKAHAPGEWAVTVELHAADIDPVAVRCARRNLAEIGGQVHEGDLYDPLPAELRGQVDILIANAPYVPTEAIGLLPPEARDYEPLAALDGGADGLDVLRRVIAGAADWLAPTGCLLVETTIDQAPALVAAACRHFLTASVARSDDHEATVLRVARSSPGSSVPRTERPVA